MRVRSWSMMRWRRWIAAAAVACGPRIDATSEAGGEGSGSAEVGNDTAWGSSAGEADSGPPREPPLVCASVCETVADCCEGDPECPGPHPNNLRCASGRCTDDGCTSDVDCDAGDPFFLTCVQLPDRWSPTCVLPCATDDDCQVFNGASCIGVTPDGRGYCEFGPECER